MRAQLRRQELIIARDRANLQQGLHNALHQLALRYRNLQEAFAQYELAQEAHGAAENESRATNGAIRRWPDELHQLSVWRLPIGAMLVSSEGFQLAQYNSELASLERETGYHLRDARYSLRGRMVSVHWPTGVGLDGAAAIRIDCELGPQGSVYPATDKPAEEAFNLKEPGKKPNGGNHSVAPAGPPSSRRSISAAESVADELISTFFSEEPVRLRHRSRLTTGNSTIPCGERSDEKLLAGS